MSGWHDVRAAEAELAEFAAKLSWAALPADVQARARLVLLDTVAHMFAGSREEAARRLLRTYPVGTGGRATVIGTRRRAAAPIAALLNGVTTTLTQYDEGHLYSRGHPAINTTPVVLAVGDEVGATGVQALEAFVTGYEVGARVGMAVGAMKAGLHPHGMSGMVGGAAAAGKLLKLDAAQFRHLLNAAATLTLFPQDDTSYAGATIHHAFIGVGAGNAVTAAYAVAAGLTAAEGALSEYFLPLAARQPDVGSLTAGLGTSFEIRRSFFKIYPTCGHVGSPVEALRVMAEATPIDVDAIAKIRIVTYHSASLLTDPHPLNALAAKFSIPWSVAAYLRTGRLDLDTYTPAMLADPTVRGLAERIEMLEDPAITPAFPHGRPSRVEVTFTDGSVRRGAMDVPRGNHGNPIGDDEVVAKADRLLRRATGAARAARVRDAVLSLDGRSRLRDVTRMLV
jgi:2-methylcitrate dehydratase PrpD